MMASRYIRVFGEWFYISDYADAYWYLTEAYDWEKRMSYADLTAETDIELLKKKIDFVHERQDRLVEAVNGIGANVQWIIDNVQGIFQMFQSPQFMAALPSMMNPAAMQQAAVQVTSEEADNV